MRSVADDCGVGLLLFDEPRFELRLDSLNGQLIRLLRYIAPRWTPRPNMVSANQHRRLNRRCSCLSVDLFERLRALRGNKTMIFSSHRFGNLTRHADVILCAVVFRLPNFLIDSLFFSIRRYMRDSVVEETGTHESLLREGGGYANVFNLQARAFLS